MTTSLKKIESNRRNAQKSTGPKSKKGKYKISQNAVKHGMYSSKVIINSPHYNEDAAEYRSLLASLKIELEPKTKFQELLVCKIANCLWRQQRAVIAETAQINKQIRNMNLDYYSDDQLETEIELRTLPNEKIHQRILRYELRLDRQLSRSYQLLKQLQQHQSKKTPAPPSRSFINQEACPPDRFGNPEDNRTNPNRCLTDDIISTNLSALSEGKKEIMSQTNPNQGNDIPDNGTKNIADINNKRYTGLNDLPLVEQIPDKDDYPEFNRTTDDKS